MNTSVAPGKTRMQQLSDLGQSVWLDYLRRGMTRSGELQALVDRGLRGQTSNPTIFEAAIGDSADYDEALGRFKSSQSDADVFESIAVEDVREAADVFRPVYDRTGGADGFVSLEVSPTLARDTEGTIAEARRLWSAVDRPNLMIKVPGTKQGWPAIERLLADGINVNITLLFSIDHYLKVSDAYLDALETRVKVGRAIDRVASVASFFVSRVDTEGDKRLQQRTGGAALAGKAAVANAHLAYAKYLEMIKSSRWKALKDKGARPQRLLWASTGTKNPAYSDVLYVDSLVGPDTINTLPPATLALFEDHGHAQKTLPSVGLEARKVLDAIAAAGVDMADVARFLEEDGVKKFAQSFDALLRVIGTKREALALKSPPRSSAQVRALDASIARRLDDLDARQVIRRTWVKDPTVWVKDPETPEIRDRLGWLTVPEFMSTQVAGLTAFANEARKEFDRVVLCGMGGSSLAPEVLWRTFGRRKGYPSLFVLDSTDPRRIAEVEQTGDLAKTLFLIASKSGTTQESDSFFRYFWERTGKKGSQFVAITDPGTPLVHLANERRFRKGFANPPDIGGRYSALSYFGLVPAALIGIDVGKLLKSALRMAENCGPLVPVFQNPAASLGVLMGEAALAKRNKLTFVLSKSIATYGLWVEQLIAESTGKNATGILPVADEPLGASSVYAADRVFVSIALAAEQDKGVEAKLDALAAVGHPVIRLSLDSAYDLGAEFFRWELATAVAGAVLGIHPFDQPNVAESKANTKAVLEGKSKPVPAASKQDLEKFVEGIKPGDYLAIMAYLPPSDEMDRRLAVIRLKLRDRLKVATTVGYGPRFLHSTGQLHKGGPPVGHFLQVTSKLDRDLPIPGERFTFGALEAAQAEGDLQALRKRGRPAIRVEGLALLEEM